MADTTARVQEWRQRLKEEGKTPLTIYLTTDEKLRLRDLADNWHCSVSDMVQQALAAFRPGSPAAPGSVPDTAHIRELIREELRTFLDKPTPDAPATETLPHVPVTGASQQASQPLLDAADLDARPGAPVALSEQPEQPALDYDATRYTLGKLCPRGHAWGTTGQSLLQQSNRKCLLCHREQGRTRREAKRQAATIG